MNKSSNFKKTLYRYYRSDLLFTAGLVVTESPRQILLPLPTAPIYTPRRVAPGCHHQSPQHGLLHQGLPCLLLPWAPLLIEGRQAAVSDHPTPGRAQDDTDTRCDRPGLPCMVNLGEIVDVRVNCLPGTMEHTN